MVIQILSSPPPEPEEIARQLEQAIREGLSGSGSEPDVVVRVASPGHFEVEIVSATFEGLSRVKQQQAVYATIKHLMAGDTAPVHAIDRMITRTP